MMQTTKWSARHKGSKNEVTNFRAIVPPFMTTLNQAYKESCEKGTNQAKCDVGLNPLK